jgi:aspartate 1-decarboxylase
LNEDLMDAGRHPQLREVLVANLDNGKRFETYAIRGARGSGMACLNGAAAYKGTIGDRLIVMVWCQLDDAERPLHHPKIVRLDEKNRVAAAAV